METNEQRDAYKFTHIPRPQKLRWTKEAVERRIEEKLREKSGNGTMSRVYHVFGHVDEALTPPVFCRLLGSKFGIRLTERETARLFRCYDKAGTGVIVLADLLQQMVPRSFTSKQFYITSQERRDEIDKKLGEESHHMENHPESLKKFRWSIEDIEKKIQDKIVGFARSSQDQFRTTFCLFDRINAGIDKSAFRRIMHRKFGLLLDPGEVEVLFSRYDRTGSGTVNFYSFFRELMPKDFPRPPTWEGGYRAPRGKKLRETDQKNFESGARPEDWNNSFIENRVGMEPNRPQHAYRDADVPGEGRRPHVDPTLRELPPSLVGFKWSLDKVEQVIRNKIRCRTLTSDQGGAEITGAFNLFADPTSLQHSGITLPVFRDTLALKFGIVLSEEEARALHRRYDIEGKGVITYYDFAKAVMPPDFGSASVGSMGREVLQRRMELLDVRMQVHEERQRRITSDLADVRAMALRGSQRASPSAASAHLPSPSPMHHSRSLPGLSSSRSPLASDTGSVRASDSSRRRRNRGGASTTGVAERRRRREGGGGAGGGLEPLGAVFGTRPAVLQERSARRSSGGVADRGARGRIRPHTTTATKGNTSGGGGGGGGGWRSNDHSRGAGRGREKLLSATPPSSTASVVPHLRL